MSDGATMPPLPNRWTKHRMRTRISLPLAGLLIGWPLALSAQPGRMDALASLERGEWELRERQDGTATKRVCLGDPGQLLQPNHSGLQCKRFILENSAQQIAISYDCGRSGQGRTTLRVETSRLVQIDSQGVSGGSPFALTIEGRRVGACRSTALAR